MPAGDYTLYVRDANLCSKTLLVTVLDLAGPLVTTATPSPATCIINDGSITTSVTGGTEPLGYSTDGLTFQSSNIFTQMPAGIYAVTVMDAMGCLNTFDNVEVLSLSNVTLTASNTTATCGNNDASITATGETGTALYEYSIDGLNFQTANTFNLLAAGNYSVTVVDANGCAKSLGVTIAVSPSSGLKVWLGLNTNWQDPINWCGGTPAITNDVLIPAGLPNYPAIDNGIAYSKNITIETGAAVTVFTQIQIAATISNQGVLNAVAGTVELNGSALQSVAGSMFYQHLIHQLIISNTSAGGVVVSSAAGDTLKISRKLSFGYDNAILTTGNQITLLSSDTATANIGIIAENVDGTPMATIDGNIIVERYYPMKRAWRLITAPIKAEASSPSIHTAWQENSAPSISGISNANASPMYGTHITGPWNAPTAYSIVVTDSGFDQSPQNNSSMKYFDKITNSYKPVTNTYTTKVTDKQGYLLFVRGDRSYEISTTTNFTVPSPANLRVRGNVNMGMISISADTGFQFIGNPYPSAIKFNDDMFVNNSAIMKTASFWLWDPLRGSAKATPTNVGGWVPIIYLGNGNYFSTYNPSLSEVNIDSAHVFDINGTIQSGAAFLIDNKSTATGNFIIHEACKIDGSNNQQFRPANVKLSYLMTNLFRIDTSNKALYWADAATTFFGKYYSNTINSNEDIRKIYGNGENISILKESSKIAVDKRKDFQPGDTIFFEVNRLKAGNYEFEIFAKEIDELDFQAYFDDKYTGIQTPISFLKHNLMNVAINSAAASFATDRFSIVFKKSLKPQLPKIKLNAFDQNGVVLLNWVTEHPENILQYFVEVSKDEWNFNASAIVPIKMEGSGNFSSIEYQPKFGNNYYRIKAVDQNGKLYYSNTELINIKSTSSNLLVYPNPIKDNKIKLLMNQMVKGKYKYSLLNTLGEVIYAGEINYSGGYQYTTIEPDKKLPAGNYQLIVAIPANQNALIKIAVL